MRYSALIDTYPPMSNLGDLSVRSRQLWLRMHSLRMVIALTVVAGVMLASFLSYVDQSSGLNGTSTRFMLSWTIWVL